MLKVPRDIYLESVEKSLARSVKARDLLSKSAKGWSDLHEKVTKKLDTITYARDATIKRLTAQLLDMTARRDDFLTEITDLHREYVETDCDECNGTGSTTDTVLANYPCSWDPMTPAEETVTVVCETCLGTKKEWGV